MELKTLNYFSCFPAHNLEYLDPVFLKLSWCPKYQKRVQLNPEMALRIRVRPCLKANHGVRDFGLLFICPSLDYSVSPKPPYCFKYPRTDIISTSDSLLLGLKLHFIWQIELRILFCLCSNLWFVVFRPSFPKLCQCPKCPEASMTQLYFFSFYTWVRPH